jgi:hypothetical protein
MRYLLILIVGIFLLQPNRGYANGQICLPSPNDDLGGTVGFDPVKDIFGPLKGARIVPLPEAGGLANYRNIVAAFDGWGMAGLRDTSAHYVSSPTGGMNELADQLWHVSAVDGTATRLASVVDAVSMLPVQMDGLAFGGGVLFAWSQNNSATIAPSGLYEIDVMTGVATPFPLTQNLNVDITGIDADTEGNLFGLDNILGEVVSIQMDGIDPTGIAYPPGVTSLYGLGIRGAGSESELFMTGPDGQLHRYYTATNTYAIYNGPHATIFENGGLGITEVPELQGDFNGDGNYDCSDIDQLIVEVVAGRNDFMFDLNGDALVDANDVSEWLALGGALELNSGNPFLVGDANLDGNVDISDFNIWNANKFTLNASWCHGDFNPDGIVDISDFNVWNANKFQSADAAVVPEPELYLPSWALVFICMVFGRNRRR